MPVTAAGTRHRVRDDLTGRVVGNWTVLRELGTRNRPSKDRPGGLWLRWWEVRCRCGKVVERSVTRIKVKGSTCGCSRRGDRHCQWSGIDGLSGSVWYEITQKAPKRGLAVEVTITEARDLFLAQGQRCALSGVPLVMSPRRGRTASLDRIDNTKGYVAGNVQWLHKDINWMKGRFTQDRFVELCRAVAAHPAS